MSQHHDDERDALPAAAGPTPRPAGLPSAGRRAGALAAASGPPRNGAAELAPAAARPPLAPSYPSAPPVPQAAADEDEASFDVVGALWRRRWWVVALTAIGVGAAVLYLSQAEPVYQSVARLLVQQSGPRILGGDSGELYAASRNFVGTQAEVLRSFPVFELAAKKKPMEQVAMLAGPEVNPLAMLRKAVVVRPSTESDILEVSARSAKPDDAATMVNTVIEAYIEYQGNSKRNTAADVLSILQAERVQRDLDVENFSKQMVDFLRRNGDVVGGPDAFGERDRAGGGTSRSALLRDQLRNVQLARMDADMLLELIRAAGDDEAKLREAMRLQPTLASVAQASGAILPMAGGGGAEADDNAALYRQLRTLKIELADMRGQLGAAHPKVAQLEGTVATLEAELAELDRQSLRSFASGVQAHAGFLAQKEKQLAGVVERERGEVLDGSVAALEYQRLADERESAMKMREVLDERIKEIDVTDDVGAMQTTILDTAKPVVAPVAPVPSKTLLIGAAGGLMLGAALALARDWADPRLRSSDELRAVLGGSPILGVIPHIKAAEKGGAGRALLAGAGVGGRGRLEVVNAPRSATAEAYRTVRTAVYFEAPEAGARSLLITSPSPGEGKSTLAANLAAAMAQAGRRVLLVDADCRRPMQHKVFELAPREGDEELAGLTDVLEGRVAPEHAAQPAGVDRLDVMPCGPIPDAPSELLGSDAFGDLLAWAERAYDNVVVDSPPVVAVTDARVLAARCDLTLLVVRANRTSRNLAAHAQDLLQRVGGRLLGAVVNDVSNASRKKYGYGYGYYNGYYAYGGEPAAARSPTRARAAVPAATLDAPAPRGPAKLPALAPRKNGAHAADPADGGAA